ncbi:MAG: PhnD/SsuA/transferrin family substrate-binding protein [Nitrospirae bacterium]|nr:PhnD/SsuA/transferrin family substrate-binding protein [Nitrospirota bacterium]
MKTTKLFYVFLVIFAIILTHSAARAEKFNLAIMQGEKNAALKFKPLVAYLQNKGIEVNLIEAPNFAAAAKMFAAGTVDAMFSGSGIAGTMIIKGLAVPLVRPLSREGHSTYHAVIIAHEGSPEFTGSGDYFKGKKVVFCSLASAGEFYYHSIPGVSAVNATIIKAASHDSAIEMLASGLGDVAIVKNHVWNKIKSRYPKLKLIGEDTGENPDGTLIVSNKTDPTLTAKISEVLLSLKDDTSTQAYLARNELDIQGYIKTTKGDFKHTLALLKKAGVDKSFDFVFK